MRLLRCLLRLALDGVDVGFLDVALARQCIRAVRTRINVLHIEFGNMNYALINGLTDNEVESNPTTANEIRVRAVKPEQAMRTASKAAGFGVESLVQLFSLKI
jgi:hypothetical protein